jgi:hypothetical protein
MRKWRTAAWRLIAHDCSTVKLTQAPFVIVVPYQAKRSQRERIGYHLGNEKEADRGRRRKVCLQRAYKRGHFQSLGNWSHSLDDVANMAFRHASDSPIGDVAEELDFQDTTYEKYKKPLIPRYGCEAWKN